MLTFATPSSAGERNGLLKDAKVSIDLRYRYEYVDQSGLSAKARASTLRARLGFESGRRAGFFVGAEFEALKPIGADEYNSTANGKTDHPVVADPEDEEVNQAFVGFEARGGTTLKLGRQRLLLDNHRFIGNVGWRQLEQTFDALSLRSTSLDRLELFYAYLSRANRVFGASNPNLSLARTHVKAHLGHAAFETSAGRLIGYAYLVEFEDTPGTSHKNLGVRFSGKRHIASRLDALYSGEFADQTAYAKGHVTNDAEYFLLEGGLAHDNVTARVGYEILGGDGTYGFQTPFATLHAFNGWADKFLVTPTTGLRDLYFSIAGKRRGFTLAGAYHDFDADKGASHYGTELDLLLSRNFEKRYTVLAKYAKYSGDNFATDTEKLWISVQAKY